MGKNTETVKLINWEAPEKNHWAIAEEVTLKGNKERRPDLVLYLNGIAIGVMELKKSTVSIGEGIRQNISNQDKEFNEWFFSTVQILIAGNNSQGLKYGAMATAEKYYLSWKEDIEDNSTNKLDKYLVKLYNKQRLLELICDFILFDGGFKKLPRFHQYFAIKEAQKKSQEKKGGIIWHTQSGKFHRTMKAILPNAIFIGFTGTPLLKKDKQTSREVFGDYMHTYKFSEAVEDEIILDLVYEARDIEQQLSSPDRYRSSGS